MGALGRCSVCPVAGQPKSTETASILSSGPCLFKTDIFNAKMH